MVPVHHLHDREPQLFEIYMRGTRENFGVLAVAGFIASEDGHCRYRSAVEAEDSDLSFVATQSNLPGVAFVKSEPWLPHFANRTFYCRLVRSTA